MTENPTVLAISQKSRRLGVAVFCGRCLIYYGSGGLASKDSSPASGAEKIINNLVRVYQPEYLALEKLVYTQQKTPPITKLRQSILKAAESNNLIVKSYSPVEARRHFCSKDKPTREKAANVLAGYYPELGKFLDGQSKWQRRYGMLIFCAVALGLYGVEEILKGGREISNL